MRIRTTSPGLGVEILDIDLAEDQPEAVVRAVRSAWVEHGLVLLRRQRIDAEAQLAFARWFGLVRPPERYVHPDLPEGAAFSHLSNVLGDGTGGSEEVMRHQDKSFEMPLRGICLYALEVPPKGGETGFIDTARAYERLDEGLQAQVNDLFATHRARSGVIRLATAGSSPEASVFRRDHPVVLRHPETRRPILFVNERNTAGIVRLDEPRSQALLARLPAVFDDEDLHYLHRWTAGDVLCWDNLRLQHYRHAFCPDEARTLRRVQLG